MLATGVFLGLTAYMATGLFLHLSFQRYFWLFLGRGGCHGANSQAPLGGAKPIIPLAGDGVNPAEGTRTASNT